MSGNITEQVRLINSTATRTLDIDLKGTKNAAAVYIVDSAGDQIDSFGIVGTVAVTNAGLTALQGAISGNKVQVDVLTMPAVTINTTGLATSAKQDTQDTSINTLLKPASTLAAVTTLGTITNVVHVDDNSGSLTVDNPTISVVGAGAGATAQRVHLSDEALAALENITVTSSGTVTATLSAETTKVIGTVNLAAAQTLATLTTITNVVHVDDNAGSLTVDGTVTANAGSGTFTVAGAVTNTVLSVVGGGTEATAQRVTIASDSTGVLSVDDNAGSLTVDAPVGTPAFVRLSDGAAAITTLPVSLASMPSTPVTGTFWQATQPVSLATLPVTNAGTFAVQAAATLAAETTKVIGTVNQGTSPWVVTGGGGGTEYTEDVAAAADPVGTSLILVRKDTPATTVTTDGDNIAQRGTNYGAAYVTLLDTAGAPVSVGGGTQYTEDIAAAADPIGTALIGVRADSLAAVTTTDGDNVAARMTNKGELYVKQVDAVPITDNAGSLTVDNNGTFAVQAALGVSTAGPIKAEDVASADADMGIPAMAIRKATPANTSGTDGDYEMLQIANGKLWTLNRGFQDSGGTDITEANTHSLKVTGTTRSTGGSFTAGAQTDTENLLGFMSSVTVQISGTWSATIEFEATVDGTNYSALTMYPSGSNIGVSNTTANGIFSAPVGGFSIFRLRVSAFTSGQADYTIYAATVGNHNPKSMTVDGTVTANLSATDNAVLDAIAASVAGTLTVTGGGGGTEYTEDAAAAANPVGNALIVVREDARAGSLTTTDGDNVALRGNNLGELYVKHTDSIGVTGTITAVTTVGTITNVVHIDDNAGSITVDGTVAVSGTVTVGSHAVTNAGTFAVQAAATLAAETTKVIGTVNIAAAQTIGITANSSVNNAQINGITPLMGNGVTGTGSQRVTIASDNTAFSVNATLAAETTKVLGVTRTADGAGNLLTSNSTTYTAKFGIDQNLLGTLGTAFSTAGKVDVKGADGDVFVRQATGTNLHTVVDSGTITTVSTVTNLSQLGGVAIAMNTGTRSTGTQRVTIATDDVVPASQSGTWTVQPGNTANTTPWLVQDSPAVSGGLSKFHLVGAATTNLTNIKASAGMVYGITAFNVATTPIYLKFHNTAGSPTAGSGVTDTYLVPSQGTANGAGLVINFDKGIAFGTGIAISTVTGIADADTAAIAASSLVLNVYYK